jgi:hypothetical protein
VVGVIPLGCFLCSDFPSHMSPNGLYIVYLG